MTPVTVLDARAPGLGQLLQCVIIWRRRRTSVNWKYWNDKCFSRPLHIPQDPESKGRFTVYTSHCGFTLATIVLRGSLRHAKPLVATPKSKAENIDPKPGTGAPAWANPFPCHDAWWRSMTVSTSLNIDPERSLTQCWIIHSTSFNTSLHKSCKIKQISV